MLMQTTNYCSFDELPIMLSISQVATVLGISRAGAYELSHSKGFPALTIGTRIVVPKNRLIAWVEERLPCGQAVR